MLKGIVMKKRMIAISYIFLFILSVAFGYGEAFQIRILHVNDFQGFAEPYKPVGSNEMVGGIANLAAEVEELRKERPSLLLSAGDMIQGNNWANLFQGESVIELMNEMRFDAMVVGNHEFDFGPEVLKKRISEANFPVLGANVEGLKVVKPYIIKELKGVQIAVIGVVTEDTPLSTHPKNIAGLKFASPMDTVQRYIAEVEDRADIIIVLSHLGHAVDRVLAERVKGIDLIVGGHSHTKIESPVEIGRTIIVQAWEYGKALGVVDLTIKDKRLIGLRGYLKEVKPEKGKEDQKVLKIVENYNQKMEAVLNEQVGEVDVDLDGERGSVRRRETNLGNLIADILRHTAKADVAIINGGGIRASIRKGKIKVKEIYTALPFDNYIVAIKLTGNQIREALEHGVSAVEEGEGRFPQVSGLSFKYSLPDKKGSRVKEVLVAGQAIDLDKEYIVATNDFLAVGGDGYKVFGEAIKTSRDFLVVGGMMKGEKIVYSDSGRWLRDVVVEYMRGMKRITLMVEGRILEIR